MQLSGQKTIDSLKSYFSLLACPVCKGALAEREHSVHCVTCDARYPFLEGTRALSLLPPDSNAPLVPAREKDHVQRRFAELAFSLSVKHGAFATFLNLGYVANNSDQQSVSGRAHRGLNQYSTQLLFEVLGDVNLDDRTLIELGSGRGGNLALVDQYFRPLHLVGVDLSRANVMFCAGRHSFASGGFVMGDVEALPLRSGIADVLLNIESAHYYPRLEVFLDEVARVLAPGGDFLFADLLPADQFARIQRLCAESQLVSRRQKDITPNVLLSCNAIAGLRADPRYATLYATFDVLPGSAAYVALERGDLAYRILTFSKAH